MADRASPNHHIVMNQHEIVWRISAARRIYPGTVDTEWHVGGAWRVGTHVFNTGNFYIWNIYGIYVARERYWSLP